MKVFPWVAAIYAICHTVYALVSTSLPPLYSRDPHDVRHPSLQLPDCWDYPKRMFDNSFAMSAITDFCKTDATVSVIDQLVISTSYVSPDPNLDLALSLGWNNVGMCLRSQLEISPAQVSGEICRRIFQSILTECMYKNNSWNIYADKALGSSGGSITLNCGLWEVNLSRRLDWWSLLRQYSLQVVSSWCRSRAAKRKPALWPLSVGHQTKQRVNDTVSTFVVNSTLPWIPLGLVDVIKRLVHYAI